MAKLGSRMREHMTRVLSQYVPKKGEQAVHESCLAWLASPAASKPPSVNAVDLQAALAEHAPSKVALLVGCSPGRWASLSAQATRKQVTSQAMGELALWLEKQLWLDKVTLVTVLAKWEDWYARAKAEPRSAATVQSGNNRGRSSAW